MRPSFSEQLYKQEYQQLYGFAYRATLNVQDAEDITQEAFGLALPRLEQLNLTPVQNRAFLRTTAKNLLKEKWQKESQHRDWWNLVTAQIERAEETANPETVFLEQLEMKDWQEKLKEVGDNAEQVLSMRLWQDMSTRQVAEKLNISEANVRQIQCRALNKLRGLLDKPKGEGLWTPNKN